MRYLLFIFFSLATPLIARGQDNNSLLEEIRVDIGDLKYALKSTQVELTILDEKINTAKKKELSNQAEQIAALEKRIVQLEKIIERTSADLRALNTNAAEALTKIESLAQQTTSHEKRLEDVAKLKGTLTNISKAMGQQTADTAKGNTYRVKAGDSLEKIARNHKVSLDTLKKLNNLTQDKIIVGQELKISNESK